MESKNSSFTTDEVIELNTKIDLIINKLEELDCGNEIIFNEIEELRNLTTLSKKTWDQVLKGKLYDIAIKNILSKDVIKEIYKALSNDGDTLLLN